MPSTDDRIGNLSHLMSGRAGASRENRRLLLTRQFLHNSVGLVDGPEGLDDSPRVDRDGASELVVVTEIKDKRLDVAVEDQADDLDLAVDHRASGVAADDVRRRDEVERSLQAKRS